MDIKNNYGNEAVFVVWTGSKFKIDDDFL